MSKKIAIIGPECTGKSTLTQDLATHFDEPFLPEYGRIYLEIYGPDYVYEDLGKISRKMVELEEKQLENTNKYLFCDTDLLMMKVWYDVKFGKVDEYLLKQLEHNKYDHYFICAPDIPWQKDPLRENPHLRDMLFERYIKEVKALGVPYTIIEGEKRTEQAISYIKSGKNPVFS